jgi:geranylgeranyl pyrophosphate synthase
MEIEDMNIDIEKFLKEKAELIDKAIEKYIPRVFNEKSLSLTLGPPRFDYEVSAVNKAIADPIWNFLDRGGKRWRPILCLLICEAFSGDSEEILDYTIIPEVVHNGTLVADDVEDASELRRGSACTYRLYGIDVAVNVANALYYLPLLTVLQNNTISTVKENRLFRIYTEEMINLSFGQAMDIAWHRGWVNIEDISENQYLQMCLYKTGTLARMAARIGAILADAENEAVAGIGRFAESIGVAFQIQDDILDLVGEEFAEKKGGLGKDITEGKITLLVINTLKKARIKDKKRLIEIISSHTQHQKERDEAIKIIKRYGSVEYAKKVAEDLVKEGWGEVDKFLSDSPAKERLKAFANYLIERRI